MYLRVEVTPRAKKESVMQLDEKTYSISVKEPALRNLANMRVKELLARILGLSTAKVHLISGHRSPRKIFEIH